MSQLYNPYSQYPIQNPYMNQPQSQPQPRNNGITWVQGIEGAKGYQVLPNSNTILMDSEIEGRFYIKTCDDLGMSKLRIFKFEEVTNYTPNTNINADLSEYVRKDELQALISNMIKPQQEVAKNEQFVQSAKQKQHKQTAIADTK